MSDVYLPSFVCSLILRVLLFESTTRHCEIQPLIELCFINLDLNHSKLTFCKKIILTF